MNLTICLLMARRFVEREQIRELVEGYHGLSDSAFERTFERDKEELRSLGVPVETGSDDPLFPDEVGYRIRRRDFELPPVDFTAEELAALGIASGVWDSARLADRATRAVAKLRTAGLDPDATRVAAFAPSVAAHEPGFESLWQATLDRQPVRFSYRGVLREVEPWQLTSRTGRWYLLGLDRTRGEGRWFKLSRLEDEPTRIGAPGEVSPPDHATIAAHRGSLEAARDTVATIAVRDGAASELVRFAEPADAVVPEGFTAWSIRLASPTDAGGLAAHGAEVFVVDPPELVDALRRHLEAVASWG